MIAELEIRPLPSPFFDERGPGTVIDTIIIHSMHNPGSSDPLSPGSCKECLDRYQVSAHYLLEQSGVVWQLVAEEKRAWHAGVSRMPQDGREGVNHFSIGIELVGTEKSGFSDEQYGALAELTINISARWPVVHILGHCHIAGERKSDPWNFDWKRYRQDLARLGLDCGKIEFPQDVI